MGNSTISVAMCTYNGAQYLLEQLDSIAAQTRLPDELVICDDRSQDETVEIIRSFAGKVTFPVRIVVNPENLGSTKNFEQVIGMCQGDIIALADQDDVWMPEKLAKIEIHFEQNPNCGYVFSDALMIDSRGDMLTSKSMWQAAKFQSWYFNEADAFNQVKSLLKQERVTGATMAIRASLVEWVLPISPLWIHDGWISLLASAGGAYGVSIPEPLIYYRLHPSQQTAVGHETIFQRVRRTRTVKNESYIKQAQRFVDAKTRLAVMKFIPYKDFYATLDLIEQKANHLFARALIHASSTNKLSRVRLVSNELLTGRYQKFSDTLFCLMKDVFL